MPQLRQSGVRNRLLAALPPEDFARLAPNFERMQLAQHATLIEAHQYAEHAFFIEDGMISFVADAGEGSIEIGLVGREGFAGISLLLGADRSLFNGIVQAESEALRVAAAPLREALGASPTLRGVLGRYVYGFIAQMGQTTYANSVLTLEGRLARWLLMVHDRVGRDELRLTHEFLSMMLNVRRSGVTAATHLLEGAGMIRARRGRITVLDRDKLQELAGDTYGMAEAEYERLLAQA